MSIVDSAIAKRLKLLPQPAAEYWEGGIVRLPTWIDGGPDGRPFRPFVAIWVSPRQHKLNLRMFQPGEDRGAGAVDVFMEFATKSKLAGCLPSRVAVSDDATADALRAALKDLPVTIAVPRTLPDMTAAVDELIAETMTPAAPGMRSAPGVTVDRMRAFADAARRFYDAKPWKRLESVDLIHIEAPDQGLGLRFATVLGAGGETFGIGFYRSPDEYDAVGSGEPGDAFDARRWLIAFGPEWEMPPDDADDWEREALPLAGGDAYPFLAAVGADQQIRRPDAGQLAWFEGLLQTITASSESEIDSGRWEKNVNTGDGRKTFVLSLPALLEPDDPDEPDEAGDDPPSFEDFVLQFREMIETGVSGTLDGLDETTGDLPENDDAQPARALEPLDRALVVAFRARRESGRRQLQLVREALSISPDCADAYLILGDRESDPAEALALYEQAVAAGERSLPEECRDFDHPGEDLFWRHPRTRPYMRARAAVADALLSMERYDEAREIWRDLLRLNPFDNQGVRHVLLVSAIEERDVATGDDLLLEFDEDDSALWLYTAALHAWSAGRKDAKKSLRQAIRENRRAVRYLSGAREWPEESELFFQPGDESEAIMIAQHIGDLWQSIEGASQWVKVEARRK